MNVTKINCASARPCDAEAIALLATRADPLGDDLSTDLPILTSERRLRRLAVVASDTGARFAREGIAHDPMAWMLAPRVMFDGRRAIDACQDKQGFLRAVMLNGLSLGLDQHPDDLDALIFDGDDDGADVDDGAPRNGESRSNWLDPKPRLFTCVVQGAIGGSDVCLQAFCAMVVGSADVMRRRLASRYGTRWRARRKSARASRRRIRRSRSCCPME